MKCSALKFGVLAAVLGISGIVAEPTETRTWTSTGGHTLEGKALQLAGGKVRLEKMDGTTLSVDLSKLSEVDRDFLQEHFGSGGEPAGEAPPEGEAADDLPYPLGTPTGEIDAGGGSTYYLYPPKSLRKGERHPVLFVMSPSGGSPRTTTHYAQGAERNRWIVAASKQSKNSFDGSKKAIDAMIEHVRSTLPVDKDRLYVSGFSGGCREAFQVATRFDEFAGVIACGAGGSVASKKQVVYGLSGTNCFNRTDMSEAFKDFDSKDSLLRFFPGKHAWGNAELCEDAMTHLNGVFLVRHKRNYPEALERYARDVMELAKENSESAPMRAFMWTSFLTERGIEAPGLEELHAKLAADPLNPLYVKGLHDIGEFAQKTFGDISGSAWKIDTKDSAACLREAKKYEGTPWKGILEAMSQDAQKF